MSSMARHCLSNCACRNDSSLTLGVANLVKAEPESEPEATPTFVHRKQYLAAAAVPPMGGACASAAPLWCRLLSAFSTWMARRPLHNG